MICVSAMLFSVYKLHSYTTELCMFEMTFYSFENLADEKWMVNFMDGGSQCRCYTSTRLSTFSCLSVSATINDPRNQTTAPSGSCNSISGNSGFKMFTVCVCLFGFSYMTHQKQTNKQTKQNKTKNTYLFRTRLTNKTVLNGWIARCTHNAYLSAPLLI